MSIPLKDVTHIAKLAHLELSQEELTKLTKELGSIVAYVQQLQEVDTEHVEPTHQTIGRENIFRDDIAVQQTLEVREQLLNAVSDRVGDYVRVKAVFQ